MFPTSPEYTKSIIVSSRMGCLIEVLSIISMLSVGNVFWCPVDKQKDVALVHKKFRTNDSDHLMLLNVMNAYLEHKHDTKWCAKNFINVSNLKTAVKIRSQLMDICKKVNLNTSPPSEPPKHSVIMASLISGSFRNLAKRCQSYGFYQTMYVDRKLYIHPSSSLFEVKPNLILYDELINTSKEYMRTCSKILVEWIRLTHNTLS